MKPRFDLWQVEREDNTNEKYKDLTIKITQSKNNGKPVLRIWKGKQSRPFVNYYYRDMEQLQKSLTEYKKEADLREVRVNEKKKVKEELKNRPTQMKAGDILTGSWGYDQTNIEMWVVLEVKGKTAKIQRCGASSREEVCFMSYKVKPDRTALYGEIETKRIQRRSYGDGSEYISFQCFNLTQWDGRMLYETCYG